MSDIRVDPFTGDMVVIAEDRHWRPNEYQQRDVRFPDSQCPFCPGNESQTPPVLALYDGNGLIQSTANGPPWIVRVVPNKYPALIAATQQSESAAGPYQRMTGSGLQEVIILAARHILSFSELDDCELAGTMRAFRDRYANAASQNEIHHVMLFVNCGPDAGASIEHIHAQLIGSPGLTEQLQRRFTRANRFQESHGISISQSVIQWELAQQDRILESTDRFVVCCPLASRFPYQVCVLPRDTIGFDKLDNSSRLELGQICRRWVGAIETITQGGSYNLLLHSPPVSNFGQDQSTEALWYVELFPRLNRAAGFEWGTGCWINTVAPENAAEQLRQSLRS